MTINCLRRCRRPLSPARLSCLVLLAAAAACVAPPETAQGTVGLSLVGQAPSGAVFRLRDAAITVTGSQSSVVWNTEDDPSRTQLSADVPVGFYSATLGDGWRLERVEGGTAITINADLLSANPVQFTVTAETRTDVSLRFQVDPEEVNLARGGYDVELDVTEQLRPKLIVADISPPSIRIFSSLAHDAAAPIRTIAGPHTTLVSPRSIAVVGDQIVVADQDANAIDFFPLSANGDVAPTRRITGAALNQPRKVLEHNGELYVSQAAGPLRVFPVTASGDATPTRSLTDTTLGIAISNGELYATLNNNEMQAYPIPAFGSPAFTSARRIRADVAGAQDICIGDPGIFVAGPGQRVRVFSNALSSQLLVTLSGPSTGLDVPWSLAILGGELYVASGDDVRVFRTNDSGDRAPLRSIGGPRTGLGDPRGLVVH